MKHETISNWAYVAVGAYGCFVNPWIGSTIIILGLASGYSHATKNWWPDWLAMWLVFSSILFMGGVQWLAVPLAFILFAFGEASRDFKVGNLKVSFITLGVLFLLGAIRLYIDSGIIALLYVSIFGLGLAVRNKKPHGHIIWHYLTAIGFLILFL